ncbi:MAG: amino acid permease [Gemmatimonadetes bacterium]|nr:amino acid permease [Gemmatimonadota bacterium]
MSFEVRLSREMRLTDITMIGVGAMIGAGIFVLTGIAAGVAGPALLITFALNGFVALLTAMAYAELGSSFHDAGGGYLWVKTALPDPNGFLSGWMSWFAHAVACSLYALGFGAYFRLVLTAAGAPQIHLGFMTLEKWLAVVVCVLFAYINFRGASETGKAGNVITVAKVIIILAFGAVGVVVMLRRPDWHAAFQPMLSNGWGGVFAAMGLTFIAFEGYEIIAQTSEEVENPKKNVPRATFLSLLIVVPIYLLVALVAVGAVHAPAGMSVTEYLGKEKETALVSVADQFIAGGGVVILIGGLLSTLSALNATIYSSSRVAFAMARDANLPQLLGQVHARRATPHYAILFSTVLIVFMAVALPIESVAAASDIMFLLLFVQVNIAVMRLRKTRPDLDRGFRIPFMPVIPVLAIGTMLFLTVFLVGHYPLSLVATGAWVVVGAFLYYGYARDHEAAFVERAAWMERIERKEYRVLVALAAPDSMESLMEVGLAIAKRHAGELVAVTVVEVPEGESLMVGRKGVRALEPQLQRAVEYGRARGIPVHPVIKISRRVSHGIVETAREESCNFIVIGQPNRQSWVERLVSTVVERVLQDAPCQVAILYGRPTREGTTGIVLPTTRSANTALAADLVPAFTAWYGAVARALTVVSPDDPKHERDRGVSAARETLEAAAFQGTLGVVAHRDVAAGLTQALRPRELVVMGAPEDAPVAALFGETVPATVAHTGWNPVVVVRDVVHKRTRRFERIFFRQE